MHPPDPIISASIYTRTPLDDVIARVVVPFRDELRHRSPTCEWSLWMMRYAKCGSHLKLRLHGLEEERLLNRRLLEAAVEQYFAALGAVDPDMKYGSRPKAPAVDQDDEQTEVYPDRTLLWTRYRRSQVSFGPNRLLLEDDRYVGHFTTCLAAGAEIVLNALHPSATDGISEPARLKVLLGALVAGLKSIDFSPGEWADYLAYHRDWLLRFKVSDRERELEMLARFNARADGMRPVMEEAWSALRRLDDPRLTDTVGYERRWREAVAGLSAFMATFRGDSRYVMDPFSNDPVFSALFKAFHGVANQLGVDMLNEALVHHVLFRAVADELVGGAVALAGA